MGTERIIVAGYGLENLQMDIQDECPKDTICPNLWFRYVINVKKAIKGKAEGQLIAVRKQHGKLEMDSGEVSIFILSKIDDINLQKKLKAKFYVEEYSTPKTVYCFKSELEHIGLVTEDEITYTPSGMWKTHCIKEDALSN
jgi:hypothetical protein